MNNQTFKPENQTICDLFLCNAIYTIPNYQRQYSWDTEKLDDLWNDLYDSYTNSPEDNYFLGSIVVIDDGRGRHELVDGQQRITTLMILFNVLVKTFPDINKNCTDILKGDLEKINKLIYFDSSNNRLLLQVDPNYNTEFNNIIISAQNYSKLEYPSQAKMKKDEPKYKFINTAKYFYDKFVQLYEEEGETGLDAFVNYILFKTNIIKIICTNQSFAIKLFLVLNDRGMELSVSDIIKSYILDKYDSNDIDYENKKLVFNANWKNIENICNEHEIKIDEFMVYYEYYKLKSNPKKQVTDELRKIIQSSEVTQLVNELKTFADNMDSIHKSTDSVIYSLRYIPWKAYVMTAMISAYQVNYPNKKELFEVMRRFFYISWISGKTLNGIKQTSFNLIAAIIDLKPIDEIKDMLNKFIIEKHLIRDAYQNLDGDNVYTDNYLKALLLSVEYDIREETNTAFYEIDNNIHIDHILPQKFFNKIEEWQNIADVETAKKYIGKLGNMALLLGKKNEEALNFGFETKMEIYTGNDKGKSGKTSFDTTQEIIDEYNQGDTEWDVDHIEARQEYLMEEIENLLGLNRSMIDLQPEEEPKINQIHKWIYNNNYFTNKDLVLNLIIDYIKEKNIQDFDSIPEEIRNFKMHWHELIRNNALDGYDYTEIEINNMKLFIRSICLTNNTIKFIKMLKNYFDFEVVSVESNKFTKENI